MGEKKLQIFMKRILVRFSLFILLISLFVSGNCSPLYYLLFQTTTSKKDSGGSIQSTLTLLALVQLNQSVRYPWGTFTDNRDGTVLFIGNAGTFGGQVYTETTLTYAKCSSGQTWLQESNSCSPDVPNQVFYCPTNDNSCNDIGTFLLNNSTSAAYTYCDTLELGGRSNWRVATKNELKLTVACSENPTDIPVDDDLVGCGSVKRYFLNTTIFPLAGAGAIGPYWTANAQTSGVAWYIDYMRGYTTGSGKAFARSVRCVSEP
ncbi:DUF1566 domain-containing protein [Leptospira bouyouniensis]|nr:DUF1566 domain-containing protein [Leptospira bouyouniensis]